MDINIAIVSDAEVITNNSMDFKPKYKEPDINKNAKAIEPKFCDGIHKEIDC